LTFDDWGGGEIINWTLKVSFLSLDTFYPKFRSFFSKNHPPPSEKLFLRVNEIIFGVESIKKNEKKTCLLMSNFSYFFPPNHQKSRIKYSSLFNHELEKNQVNSEFVINKFLSLERLN